MTQYSHEVQQYNAIPEKFFMSGTASPSFPLGLTVQVVKTPVPSGNTIQVTQDCVSEYVYVEAGLTMVANGVYAIQNNATSGSEFVTAAVATDSITGFYGVPEIAYSSGTYGFIQTKGIASCIATTSSVTGGNTVKAVDGDNTVVDESGSTETASTLGYAYADIAATGTGSIYLLGKRITV